MAGCTSTKLRERTKDRERTLVYGASFAYPRHARSSFLVSSVTQHKDDLGATVLGDMTTPCPTVDRDDIAGFSDCCRMPIESIVPLDGNQKKS